MKIVFESRIRRLIKYDGPCCSSCHADMDERGYNGIHIDFGKEREAEVCCAVANAYYKWLTNRCASKHERQ